MSTDAELIASCQAGHLEDFDALYTRHLKGVYAFIFYRTMDKMTAEDLTSQTFLKALEHIGSYDLRKGAFSTWLYRIARNTVTDHYRTFKRTEDIENVWDIPNDDNPFLDADKSLDRDRIHEALQKIDRDKRDVVLMRLWDGLSYKEIAAITGKSEAACKMTFARTVEELRSRMTPATFALLLFTLCNPPSIL